MSSLAEPLSPENPLATSELAGEPAPRTYAAQVVRDTVRRKGAMLGLAWIAVVATGAVVAPFVANTHPIYLKMEGRVSSPMLRHLGPADVVLPVLVLTAAVL